MTDFAALIGSAVAQAHSLTASLRVTVQHHVQAGEGTYAATYAAPVDVEAIWIDQKRPLKMDDGIDRFSMAKLVFTQPLEVGEHDKFTLPNGLTWPVLDVKGPRDPGGSPYATTVLLGTRPARAT